MILTSCYFVTLITAETNPAYAQRTKLPAWAKRHELLDAISRHQVVIVAGETGCGKTTQLPQFILDDAIQRGEGGGTFLTYILV